MLDCEVLFPALQQAHVRAFDAYARRIFFFFPQRVMARPSRDSARDTCAAHERGSACLLIQVTRPPVRLSDSRRAHKFRHCGSGRSYGGAAGE